MLYVEANVSGVPPQSLVWYSCLCTTSVKLRKKPLGSINKYNTSVAVRFSVLMLNTMSAHAELHGAACDAWSYTVDTV